MPTKPDVIARNVLSPNVNAEMFPEMFPGVREVQFIPSVDERISPEVPAASTIPSPCVTRFRVADVDTVSAKAVHVRSAGLDGSTYMAIVTASDPPTASITVTPRKWERGGMTGGSPLSRASTRTVLAGPLGTCKVTTMVVPVTGNVCTMLSIPAPLMVNRIELTVGGIVAASGRGVARDDAAAGAAAAP
ncbi:MAG: hypothetical protein B7Z74_11190, partial [Deltaproteobacteria bacterium 21-66-5]